MIMKNQSRSLQALERCRGPGRFRCRKQVPERCKGKRVAASGFSCRQGAGFQNVAYIAGSFAESRFSWERFQLQGAGSRVRQKKERCRGKLTLHLLQSAAESRFSCGKQFPLQSPGAAAESRSRSVCISLQNLGAASVGID